MNSHPKLVIQCRCLPPSKDKEIFLNFTIYTDKDYNQYLFHQFIRLEEWRSVDYFAKKDRLYLHHTCYSLH